jgi:hypothetical protein
MARQKNYKVSFSDDERRNLRKILKRTQTLQTGEVVVQFCLMPMNSRMVIYHIIR